MSNRVVVPLTTYTVRRLIQLAVEMREAQVSFFTSKSARMLALAKKREVAFDRLLLSLDSGEFQVPGNYLSQLFPSAPESVQEWFLEHPEFAGLLHVSPAGALPPVNKPNLAGV